MNDLDIQISQRLQAMSTQLDMWLEENTALQRQMNSREQATQLRLEHELLENAKIIAIHLIKLYDNERGINGVLNQEDNQAHRSIDSIVSLFKGRG